MDFPYVEDLTMFSQPSSSSSPFRLCMVSSTCSACSTACAEYDMTCTDDDQFWTLSPSLKTCCIDEFSLETAQHVRVVIDELSDDGHVCTPCDVILDSGADTSVLPLRFSHVGESCDAPNTMFVDAQGCPLSIASTRIATLQFGKLHSEKSSLLQMSQHL